MGIIKRNDISYGGGGGSDIEQFIGTTEEWEALSDAEKDRYLDKEVILTDDSSGGEGDLDVYSEEETKTNKVWIDGKPIYRRVFIGSWTATVGIWTATDISTVGFETLVSISCKRNAKEGNLPFVHPEMGDTINLATSTGTYTITQIILEYTKK